MEKKGNNRNSISRRTFRAILFLAGGISLAAIALGFFLYADEASREYRLRTLQLAETVSALMDMSAMDVEDWELLADMAAFEGVDNSEIFTDLDTDDVALALLTDILKKNEADQIYLGIINPGDGWLMYCLDVHKDKNGAILSYQTGYTEFLPADYFDAFLNGKSMGFLDRIYGLDPIPSLIRRDPVEKYRCIAAVDLMEINGIHVMVFVEMDLNPIVKVAVTFLIIYVILLMILTAAGAFLMNRWTRIMVVQPINQLAAAADEYAKDKQSGSSHGNHFGQLNIRTRDEIENLSRTMDNMEKDLADYEANLTRAVAEKQRISTELSVAERIQAGVLPRVFPPVDGQSAYDLFAAMTPAKEVGGDFYDFFPVDDDRIALVIADVSGKGIPGALFMMHSMNVIRNRVLADDSPGEALTEVNTQLAEGNDAEMFVTVWLAVIDLNTGKGIAANAGHEHPALRRAGGQFELVKYRHSPVLGMMEGLQIREHEFSLFPGDSLFVYTDGVTEATSRSQELFGTDRMLEALNRNPDGNSRQLIGNVTESIAEFVDGADQFDDITMLCFRYFGNHRQE